MLWQFEMVFHSWKRVNNKQNIAKQCQTWELKRWVSWVWSLALLALWYGLHGLCPQNLVWAEHRCCNSILALHPCTSGLQSYYEWIWIIMTCLWPIQKMTSWWRSFSSCIHFGHSNRLAAAASTMSTIPQATSDVPVIYHLFNTQHR